MSLESRKKLSETHRRKRPWMVGIKHTEEARQKMSKAKVGRIPWNKNKTGGTSGMKGKKHTLETLKKISETGRGRIPWNKGIKHSKVSGKNHWNWQGGIASLHSKIRNSVEMKLWREAVFKRDNYMCIFGGKEHGSKLQADHIKPFALFPELRFAIDNGRTLCEDCHKKIGWNLFRENNPNYN